MNSLPKVPTLVNVLSALVSGTSVVAQYILVHQTLILGLFPSKDTLLVTAVIGLIGALWPDKPAPSTTSNTPNPEPPSTPVTPAGN
jgi:hypothetical protein